MLSHNTGTDPRVRTNFRLTLSNCYCCLTSPFLQEKVWLRYLRLFHFRGFDRTTRTTPGSAPWPCLFTINEPEVNVKCCICCEMRRLEAKNVNVRRRGRKTKTNLVNVTRKDGAIDFYYFFGRVARGRGCS